MNHRLSRSLHSTLPALTYLAAISLLGCGSAVDAGASGAGGGPSGGQGGQGGDGGSVDCTLPAPGDPFQFVINNVGARALTLTYGCGTALPITIDTTEGARGIGVESASDVGVSCDEIYAGKVYDFWTDCGPGYGTTLQPGESTVIDWDRRVYVGFTAPGACTGDGEVANCALGVPVGEATSGTLTICDEAYPGGYCGTNHGELVPFGLDLGLSSVSIDIQ